MNKKTFNPNEWLDEEPSISAESKIDNEKPVPVEQEINELVSRVESAAIDIAPTYSDWRDIGFALADALGENGRDYYQRLSRFYPNYNSVETDRQFSSCLNAHGHGITVKTLFHLAKQAGIDLHSTSKSSSQFTPNTLKTSKTAVEVYEVFEDNESVTNEQMPTFHESIKDTIPDFFKNIVVLANSPEDADLLLLGSLTVLSACLPNISGIYDGREVYPNLFLFVTAQASAGKGRLSLCRHLIEPIHKQLREQYAVAMEQYRRQQAEYVMNKKNPDAEPPQEPPLKTLLIPANSSSTAVYQVLNNNNGVGLIFETEGDTLANTFKSDFGNFSDGFRKAFHHETISYNRRKDHEFVELSRPRLSALLSGTPRQILSLIPDAENGLFSRFIFYCLNVRLVWNDVFAVRDVTIDSYFERFGEQFFNLYKTLQMSQPIRFSLTAQQQAEFHAFFEQVQTEYSSVFGTDFIASVRRLGLITFRIAMIFTSLRIIEIGEFQTTLFCSDSDFQATKTMVEILLKHTAKVYQLLPSVTTETAIGSKNQLKQHYFGTLPPDFDKQTAMAAAQKQGIPPKTAERYLKQWCLSGQLNHTAHGKYSKP
ncbi:MAG: DUF3987 domain-containing protein [Bacteroidales bacterium]|nr:DUF3987 domain-containing protein [Bacteroidales bacterium]